MESLSLGFEPPAVQFHNCPAMPSNRRRCDVRRHLRVQTVRLAGDTNSTPTDGGPQRAKRPSGQAAKSSITSYRNPSSLLTARANASSYPLAVVVFHAHAYLGDSTWQPINQVLKVLQSRRMRQSPLRKKCQTHRSHLPTNQKPAALAAPTAVRRKRHPSAEIKSSSPLATA